MSPDRLRWCAQLISLGKCVVELDADRRANYRYSAQMITTALAVGSDGAINLGNGPTFGILLAILFLHGIVCSAATSVLARLNLFYVLINGELVARDLFSLFQF